MESALGHLDNHIGRGGQDHRSIRMLEKPLVTPRIFSSRENFYEALRRIKAQYFGAVMNPRNKLTVTKKQYDSYFKFTFIRNPWARAFSWYKAVMRDKITMSNLKITGQPSLNEALRQYSGKGLLMPQIYWIKNFGGSIPLNYIGRFENMVEDFQEVSREIHIPQVTLPYKLKGSSEDYREHYDEDSKRIIKDEMGSSLPLTHVVN